MFILAIYEEASEFLNKLIDDSNCNSDNNNRNTQQPLVRKGLIDPSQEYNQLVETSTAKRSINYTQSHPSEMSKKQK